MASGLPVVRGCRKCGLWRFRRRVVPGEGRVPADVMIIGEAPGKAENLLGRPFVGPSGRVLRMALGVAGELVGLPTPRLYITNLLACRPCDERGGPNRTPNHQEMVACWARLRDTALAVKAEHVILLGRTAQDFCRGRFPRTVSLPHPAYVLRRGGEGSTEYRLLVRGLEEVFRACNTR